MAEKSGFFNARETEYGTYDREYDAEQFAEYFANFISNGVYANPANQLKVVFDDLPNKPFVVIVRKGKAYIDGYWYELTEDMEITIPANTKAYIVKDVIRCTLNKAERKVSIVLEEDVTSDYPTNNNNRHDLILSTIIVQPNASKLNAKDIIDKRPDKTYCGFVTGVIDQIDTTELFQQYDDAFQNWFNEMKDQLSTDAAGNLQIQIGNLQKQTGLLSNLKTTVKDSIVNAINSLYDSIIGKTLKTLEEVSSNTEQGYYVDALVIDELNSKTIKAFGASESDYISFTAPFDCYAIIGFSCLGWGYDGGFLEFQIKSSEPLPEIFAHTGGCSGNNSVYIPLLAKSCFSGLKKGKTYSFSRKNLYGSFGASWNIKWSAICIPA